MKKLKSKCHVLRGEKCANIKTHTHTHTNHAYDKSINQSRSMNLKKKLNKQEKMRKFDSGSEFAWFNL